ncbi:DUF4315 family protein [Christensenellaceae bacterium OttesenSCG-928-L17]|nr:DUF4315 family protein [Christensenellaceae bacterium OttesenSCG-928-L17]
MNPKIAKINAEYEKNRSKIAEIQARQRELDKARTELENNDILELVHSYKLDIDGLSALLQSMKSSPVPVTGTKIKEDFDNEDA